MAVTDVDAPLPDLVLAPGSTITVSTGVSGALVTQLNVYGFTPPTEQAETVTEIPPLFSYGPNA